MARAVKHKPIYKPCIDCGEIVHHNTAKRCVKCANLHKAKVSTGKCKGEKKPKYLKLKNGVEVLNNCFGQELAQDWSKIYMRTY